MTIAEFVVDLDNISDSGELFPSPIGTDKWVAFHGTSGVHADSIECNGLRQDKGIVSLTDLKAIAAIYDSMMWTGADVGGYAILKPWSLDHDHRCGPSPIFFHDDSLRALTFALRDFAGGEKARAVRRAIADLHRYLKEQELRERHAREVWRNVDPSIRAIPDSKRQACFANLAPPQRALLLRQLNWVPVDLNALRKQVAALDEVYALCNDAYNRHVCGIVYAVQFSPTNLVEMRYNGPMGIQVFASIKADQILAKAVLTLEDEQRWKLRIGSLRSPKWLERKLAHSSDGLIAALTQREDSIKSIAGKE